ncbi:MAG: ribbon-helix-helix protein, CopG family [Oscillospiraceae bacterium]|nr:ribbon-helix-helix protein, CopG family [Oscillospiraceae bacterium]
MEEKTLVIRPKGDDGYRTFSVRVKREIVEKIETIAKQTGRTRNELIGIFLNYAADHCEVENK